MRLLFSSTSGLGHLQPILPLATAAHRAGHSVLVAVPSDAVERIRGIDVVPVGWTGPERMAQFKARFPESDGMTGLELATFMFPRMFGPAAVAAVTQLFAAASEWRPDVIVHEVGEFAAPAVASALGIPNVSHGFGLVIPRERMAAAAAFAAPAWEQLGLEPAELGGMYDHAYIDIYPPSLQPEDLSYLPVRLPRRPASGDALPDDQLPDRVARLAQDDRPLLYLTFGTTFNVNRTFAAAVHALGELDANVVVTVGPKGDPDTFGPQPPNVHIERYIPQSLLLPTTTAVASHAGSGTFLAAIAAGVPQLFLPQAADQFRNAAVGHDAGLGIDARDADEDFIRTAMTDLITDHDRFATHARAVAREIAAMPDDYAVLDDIHALIR